MLASMTEQQKRGTERFVLPPISALEEYIPKHHHNDKNTHNFNMLSPPNSFNSSTTSPSSLSSCQSTVLIQHPPSPPRTAFEKMDTPIYPIGTQEVSNNNVPNSHPNNSILRTVSSDVDQVVQQANSLCENMIHYKPYLLPSNTSNQREDELRPWMDDMIGKANQVLNALLRLRKQQMVSAPSPQPSHHRSLSNEQHHSFTYHHPHYNGSTQSLPSPPTSSSSSRITITKRDWPNSITHDPTASMTRTSIPSRQRKRGKRSNFQGRCHSCNISETPEWRRGPDGARTLCNACGLHYAKLARKKAASSSHRNTPSV